ncbi:MAG: hypothetical protein KZQ94_10380 [Candidatus Thiodiazotropha sp. (ex Troendleina suluensis)]|nr:hypothetical protein [Candidatus Thiodiazotropha sp. (ex Troendleina suluensis)]
MPKKLILTGRVVATKSKKPINLGPGTGTTEIELPDKAYGLKDAEIERIVRSGAGKIVSQETDGEAAQGDDPNAGGGGSKTE